MDDVRIDEEDIAVFRKVLAYYYLCDAFTWCRRNGLKCDGNLARNMASAMQCDDARGPWYWSRFEQAYEKCRDLLI